MTAAIDVKPVDHAKAHTGADLLPGSAVAHLPHALAAAMDAYAAAGLTVTDPQREPESVEYSACRFGLEGRVVVFRAAKTTPAKVGQFVTLWKRPMAGDPIAPLDSGDGVDVVVVSVADTIHCGQFIFDQQALLNHGVMSRGGQGGKRAIRVYPPWTRPVAKDAIRTQQWQLRYFVALTPNACQSARLRALMRV